ncbi:hypothetical protein AURDEDRAFT_129083 [Auricularia subglabra TFB-10046 SS5]|nr:hypothetical protein AURDEDRAFT_129083 [Auricularia subglabra TFB-10046 SS5]
MRAVLGDIASFSTVLKEVSATLERRGTHILPEIANGIQHAVGACNEILDTELRKVAAFKQHITGAIGVTGWRAYCAVLGWDLPRAFPEARLTSVIMLQILTLFPNSNGEAEMMQQLNNHTSTLQCVTTTQARIQETLEIQGTTMRRIALVIQDIQPRFDVGVPSFRFFDRVSGNYYLPFARTSLQRLRDVYIQYTKRAGVLDHKMLVDDSVNEFAVELE